MSILIKGKQSLKNNQIWDNALVLLTKILIISQFMIINIKKLEILMASPEENFIQKIAARR